MKTTTQHSPTPWTAHTVIKAEPSMSGVLNIRSGDYNVLAMTPRYGTADEANAHFILQACNAHAGLVESLRNLADLCEGRELFPQAVSNARAILATLEA